MAKKKLFTKFNVKNLFTRTLETQLAVFNTGVEFWNRVARDSLKLGDALGEGLSDYKKDSGNAKKALRKMAGSGLHFLNDLSLMPTHLKKSFTSEMEKVRKTNKSSATSKKSTRRKRQTRRTAKAQ